MRRIERGLQLRLSLCGLHTDAWASAAIFSALIRLLHLGQQPLALLSRRLACPYPRGLCAACSSACCFSFSRFSFASWACMCCCFAASAKAAAASASVCSRLSCSCALPSALSAASAAAAV